MNVQSSYDTIAAEYAQRLFHELQQKPLDCQLLDSFAADTGQRGLVADLGCGPGHVTRYLSERGVRTIGFDLSPGMLAQAKRLNPGLPFWAGDMRVLPMAKESCAGVVAFYSLLHFMREEVGLVLCECWRVLRPGGLLLVAFHAGDEIRHVEELWGHAVQLDFVFFQAAEMAGYLQAAGFEIEDVIERAPYPDVEVQTQRAYLCARKPKQGNKSPAGAVAQGPR
jgi:SAM-dependent methyltransferase